MGPYERHDWLGRACWRQFDGFWASLMDLGGEIWSFSRSLKQSGKHDIFTFIGENHLDRQSVVGIFPLGSYSAPFASIPLILAVSSGCSYIVIFGSQCWEPSRSTERDRFLPFGFVFSPVWLETLVFGRIQDVVKKMKESVFGIQG